VSQKFCFYVQDYGRCSLVFDVPIGRLRV